MGDRVGNRGPQVEAGASVRAWFDADGWKLDPGLLRGELQQRGADTDTIVELLDEGAERRRALPPAEPKSAPPPAARLAPEPTSPDQAAPPQNLEAEESVLGAMMLSPGAIIACREILQSADFYRESHAKVYRAALALHDGGVPVDAITLTDALEERGELEKIGGRVRLHELAALVPASANAAHYARIVAETAQLRGLIRAGGEISRLGWDRPGDTSALLEQALRIAEEATAKPAHMQLRDRLIPGGSFILDQPDTGHTVWGQGDEIGWAAGEGLMLAGPQGVGKTTLMQQLALARAGFRDHVLGMPIAADLRKVLYLAADRPAQASRSLARMVDPGMRERLDERLTVHRGPPDTLINSDPRALLRLAQQADAGTIVVDSLKDVAVKISDDETGAKVNLAYQYLLAEGVELLVGHHQRKASTDNKRPDKLDDVYGSNWLTAGLGSVLLLWGEPGDVIVELKHLKQPREELGPWNIQHDHVKGQTTVARRPDLVDLLYRASTDGLTATGAAELVLEKENPSRNEVEKTRRKLERLVEAGRIVKIPGRTGGSGGGAEQSARFYFNGGTADVPA